jgi:hypothetical protein
MSQRIVIIVTLLLTILRMIFWGTYDYDTLENEVQNSTCN